MLVLSIFSTAASKIPQTSSEALELFEEMARRKLQRNVGESMGGVVLLERAMFTE